jgi:hypothetical protein
MVDFRDRIRDLEGAAVEPVRVYCQTVRVRNWRADRIGRRSDALVKDLDIVLTGQP